MIIGNRADEYAKQAQQDEFAVFPLAEALAQADIALILLPDEVMFQLASQGLFQQTKQHALLIFASGYNLTFGEVELPKHVDIALLAPRMIGTGVRESYLRGEGFFSFINAERDVTGTAWQRLLGVAEAVGTLRKGAVQLSAKHEAELDLFNEQAFGPAFGRVLLSSIETLLEAGYPKEAVLLEMYLSGELGHIFREMSDTGLFGNLAHHSPVSQYGAISRGIKFLKFRFKPTMKKVLTKIQSGGFAREWRTEARLGFPRFRLLKYFAFRQPLRNMERDVMRTLGN